jgi:translocation and assembly module TamB
LKTAARWIIGVALGLIALSALTVGATLTVLQTRWGSEQARRIALPRINAALAGQVTLDGLSVRTHRLILTRAALHDPQGGLVARIERIDIAFTIMALLHHRLEIDSVEIDRPEIHLVQDADGTNLQRALAPRQASLVKPAAPKPANPSGGGAGWQVELRRLTISDGTVDFRSVVPGDQRHAHLSDLGLESHARYDTASAAIEAGVDLDFEGGRLAGSVRTPCAGCMRADIDTLRLPAVLLRSLVPGLAVEGAVLARGTISKTGDVVATDIRIDAGGGWIDTRGEIDIVQLRTHGPGLTVRVRNLDLARLLPNTPVSNLAADLHVVGGATAGQHDLTALDGSLQLSMPPGRLDGRRVGPIGLTVRAAGGRYQIADLLAKLPGVDVTGHGSATTREADIHLRVDATDLGALARSLAPPGGPPPLALAGKGRLDVALTGPLQRPMLRVAGKIPALRVGDNRARGLTVSAVVPDIRRPGAADIDLGAPVVNLGDQVLRGVRVTLRAAAPHLTLTARTTAPYPLAIDVDGRRDSANAVTLNVLTLRYPEATWALTRPVKIRLDDGGKFAIESLALRAGKQSIEADITSSTTRNRRGFKGRVAIAALDLGQLPRALVPPRLALGGLLNVDARISGATSDPQVDARVVLKAGRVRGYRDLNLAVDARYAGARARGTLDASGLGTALQARFDVPTAWPPRDPRAPVHLDLTLADTDLAGVMNALAKASGEAVLAPAPPAHASANTGATATQAASGKVTTATTTAAPPRVKGHAHVTVHLDGAARAPTLAVEVTARGLAVDQQAVGDVRLSIAAEGDRPSRARLEVANIAGATATAGGPAQTRITIQTPLSLQRLLRKAPTSDELMHVPLQLTGDVERLPLAVVAQLARYRSSTHVGGTLSSHVAISGTALDPKGTLTLDVGGATSGRFPPTDARVELDLDPHAVEARVRVVRKQHALLALVARVGVGAGAGVAAVRDPTLVALQDAPLKIRAVVGPLAMQRLGLPPETDRDPPRVLKGNLQADLTIDGSLRVPRAMMHVYAQDVRLDKALIGVGRLEVSYADHQGQVDARLTSANGGSLHAHSVTRADLGYPAVMRLDTHTLPLDARLDADRFDLQGFSGITQGLRTVGGLLTAAATVQGTTADPRVSGKIELSKGAIAVTGLGEYKDIHLAAHGDQQKLTLDDLSLKSGSGRAHVTGAGTHATGRGYDVAAHADVKGFPIYQEGQPLAQATISADVKGTVAPFSTKASVEIHDARIELSEAKRKDLQSLSAPDDVVLVDDGKPLNRAQTDKLRALLAEQSRKEKESAQDDEPDSDEGGAKADAKAGAKTDAKAGNAGGTVTLPPHEPTRRVVRVLVNAPRRLWVTGKDAYLELGLSDGFRVSVTDQTRVFGQVKVLRGRIDEFGRRFDLKADSTLQFDGAPDRPELDVSAQYLNEKENVTVVWTAKGPLDHLTIAVSSPNRPDLTESQLYTLVITGRLDFGGAAAGSSSSPSSQAASFLGGALAARLQKTLAKTLPLDVLTIQAGSGEGLTGTQLEAGRYVTDKLYVGYVGRVGADPALYQNRNAVHVEYQLSSRWGFDGEYGDVGTGSLDLMWKKSY